MSGAGAPPPTLSVAVSDPSQVGEARRLATQMSRRLGHDETTAGRVGIVATEAAGNLIKHGRGGELLMRPLRGDDERGLEIMALDRGPGIADLGRAFQDGHSTAGTPGTGLGAIRRLSTVFDITSLPGRGTAVLSQIWPAKAADSITHGAVCLPKPGEQEPGDVWDVQPLPDGVRVLVADGLGHGPLAREAALCVRDTLAKAAPGPARALEAAHLAARATRGAAAAVAEVDAQGAVRYAGIGNVTGVVLGPNASQSLVSLNGTLGQGLVRPREFGYSVAAGSLLVMCSDGLGTRWSLDAYPGLQARHPSLVAGVLYRDHSRGRDDVTVLAVRLGSA